MGRTNQLEFVEAFYFGPHFVLVWRCRCLGCVSVCLTRPPRASIASIPGDN